MILLPILVQSKYWILNETNFEDILDGSKPFFVKWYSPVCGHCLDMKKDFDIAATMIDTVDFGEIDCVENKNFCERMHITGYPTIQFLRSAYSKPVKFYGKRTADNFLGFLESITGTKANRPVKMTNRLNFSNLGSEIQSNNCSIVYFYAEKEKQYEFNFPHLEFINKILYHEANTSLMAFNCEMYPTLCFKYNISLPPQIIGFRPNESIARTFYGNPRDVDEVVDFANQFCGLHRTSNGVLDEYYGVGNAIEIAIKYFNAINKESVIKEAEESGHEFEAKVAKRLLNGEVDQIRKDIVKLESVLNTNMSSMKSLDRIATRRNIMKVFILAYDDQKNSEENDYKIFNRYYEAFEDHKEKNLPINNSIFIAPREPSHKRRFDGKLVEDDEPEEVTYAENQEQAATPKAKPIAIPRTESQDTEYVDDEV